MKIHVQTHEIGFVWDSQEKDPLHEWKRKAKQNKVISVCVYILVWQWKILYLSTELLKIPFSLK